MIIQIELELSDKKGKAKEWPPVKNGICSDLNLEISIDLKSFWCHVCVSGSVTSVSLKVRRVRRCCRPARDVNHVFG